jgi:hypothetical protein
MSNLGKRLATAYCNGFISKEFDLENAIIEAEGPDWILVRTKNDVVYSQQFKNEWAGEKQRLVDVWTSEKQ